MDNYGSKGYSGFANRDLWQKSTVFTPRIAAIVEIYPSCAFAKDRPFRDGIENENAAPAGPRNGANFDRKPQQLSDADYKTIARLDAIALSVGPDENGLLPSSVLLAIGLADVIEPDADLEPSLGWQDRGPHRIYRMTCRDDYAARHCLDLECEADDEPTLGANELVRSDGWVNVHTQEHWGECKRHPDECEDVSEDEGACVQSQPHDPEPDLETTSLETHGCGFSHGGRATAFDDDEDDTWRGELDDSECEGGIDPLHLLGGGADERLEAAIKGGAQ